MTTNIENFALIIGAMKSGTTSLFDYLSQHPEICGCRQKEPNFFVDDSSWSKGFDWYQSLWKWNPSVHKIALEASNSYTKVPVWPNAAERISQIKAKFKLIYIMRNPLKRIESHYNFSRTFMRQRHRSFFEIMPRCIAISKYGMQLDEYYKRFPAKDILLLYFEDLKRQPIKVAKKVCEFLNIDVSYEFHGLREVKNLTLVQSPLLYAIKRNKKLHNLILSIFPQKLRILVTNRMKSKTKGKFKLSPEQRQFVLSELEKDLEKLKEKYGVETERWAL